MILFDNNFGFYTERVFAELSRKAQLSSKLELI